MGSPAFPLPKKLDLYGIVPQHGRKVAPGLRLGAGIELSRVRGEGLPGAAMLETAAAATAAGRRKSRSFSPNGLRSHLNALKKGRPDPNIGGAGGDGVFEVAAHTE